MIPTLKIPMMIDTPTTAVVYWEGRTRFAKKIHPTWRILSKDGLNTTELTLRPTIISKQKILTFLLVTDIFFALDI